MKRELVIELLVKFFRDEFDTDPAYVDEWVEGNGEDTDAFIEALNAIAPKE